MSERCWCAMDRNESREVRIVVGSFYRRITLQVYVKAAESKAVGQHKQTKNRLGSRAGM